jgi:hypothetical protein
MVVDADSAVSKRNRHLWAGWGLRPRGNPFSPHCSRALFAKNAGYPEGEALLRRRRPGWDHLPPRGTGDSDA